MNSFLLANTQPSIQAALALMLRTRFDSAEIFTATDWEGLLTLAATHRPQIILLDWDLPGYQAAQGITALKQIHPQGMVIALGTQIAPNGAELLPGVAAYFSRLEPPERLVEMLRALTTSPSSLAPERQSPI